MSTFLQIINNGIVFNDAQPSQVSGFGLASYTGQFRSKEYDIFDSNMGKLVLNVTRLNHLRFFPNLLKDCVSFSLFGQKQNILRNASHA